MTHSDIFVNITDLTELKKAYKAAALKYHPDCGGSDADMKEINAAYEAKFTELKQIYNSTATSEKQTTEAPEEFIAIINTLLRLDGLMIELCGCWLWIGGNTRKHKDTLKAAGCNYAPKKKMWSWHHAKDGSLFYRGNRSMAEIRYKYGSEIYTTKSSALLAK